MVVCIAAVESADSQDVSAFGVNPVQAAAGLASAQRAAVATNRAAKPAEKPKPQGNGHDDIVEIEQALKSSDPDKDRRHDAPPEQRHARRDPSTPPNTASDQSTKHLDLQG
jgi:hypothetical protein